MDHSRTTLRTAVYNLLVSQTSAGTNVYTNRETRLWESELPAILIHTKEETAIPRGINARQYIRTLQLTIEIKVEANDSTDDALDAIALEVEDIITANPNISGTAMSIIYKSTHVTLDSESETEKGVCTLTYEVQYIA